MQETHSHGLGTCAGDGVRDFRNSFGAERNEDLLAEGHLTRRLFGMIVRRLAALSVPGG